MNSRVERKTVDLSLFPDLVVIYLGMRVNALTGVKTLFGFGPQIKNSVDQKPEGLLLHENFIMSLIPLQTLLGRVGGDTAVGGRQSLG